MNATTAAILVIGVLVAGALVAGAFVLSKKPAPAPVVVGAPGSADNRRDPLGSVLAGATAGAVSGLIQFGFRDDDDK